MDDRQQRDQRLREALARMRVWKTGERYYALTLTATEDNQRLWSAHSHYAGPSERYPGWERRAASIVDAGKMTSLWEEIGQSWLAVHDRVELYLWIRLGGNALVQPTVAQEWLPDQVAVREVAPNGPIGFLNADSLTPQQRRRRPTRKVGKRVTQRDRGVCRRCGRSDDDVSLTKHHALPYSAGGLTQESNLVLLCTACHDALHAGESWYPDPALLYGILLRHENVRLDEDHDAAVRRHRLLITQLIR